MAKKRTNTKVKPRGDAAPIRQVEIRTDAGPSYFLTTELEHMLTEVYREDLPEIRIFDFIPVSTEVPAGAETISYRQYTVVGAAAIIRSPSTDIPRVDLYSVKYTSPVHTIATKYGYTIDELESADFAGLPLDRDRGIEAKAIIARTASAIAVSGGTAYGVPDLPGVLSNANIPTASAPNGVGGSPTWALKTADEILFDMANLVSDVVESTLGIEAPDTLLMPIEQFERITQLRVGSDTTDTVYSYFLRTNPHIKRISWLRELDGAGAGATDVLLALSSNPSKIKYHMPLPFQQRPAQERDLNVEIVCRERSGGVVIPKPLAHRMLTGI